MCNSDDLISQFNDEDLIESITTLIPAESNIQSVVTSKGIAQLGDAFVNFLFSLSRSIAYKRASGCKVSDSILSNAYRTSLIKKKVLLKGDRDKIGDGIEAIILWAWIKNYFTVKEILDTFISHLATVPSNERNIEKTTAAEAFKNLLNKLTKRLEMKENR